MSTTLKLTAELSLPLDIVTARIATYGTSGAGKTAFGRLLAERVHAAGHRFCAIDLKNDWWGLKSSADGKAEGIPIVVFGGPRRDVQIYPDAGAAVADTVCSIEQSCVIDLDEFSKGKQLKFLTQFMERLYDVNREALLLIADEADRYAPQKAMSVEANISLGAAEDICRRGRKRGIGSMWLTQRTAVLNKNVSDICDLTVVFRTPGARDLDELKDRVSRVADKEHVAEVMRLAPGLEDGQAIFLSSHPKLRDFLPAHAQPIQLPLPETYDSSATPGVGKRKAEPKVLAKADLAEIEQKMAEQVERAKAEDPAALRRELAELKRENAKLQQMAPNSLPKIQIKEVPVIDKTAREQISADLKRAEKSVSDAVLFVISARRDFTAAVARFDPAFLHDRPAVNEPQDAVRSIFAAAGADMVDGRRKIALPEGLPRPAAQPDRRHGPGIGGASLGGGEKRVLIAIAQHDGGVTPEQLTVLTGYKRSSRNTYLQRLTSNGLASKRGDRIVATEEGVELLGSDYEPLPKGRALQEYWLAKLSGGENAILLYVLEAHPAAVDREEMGQALGYQRSSRNTYIQRLQARELIWSDREGLHASALFFDTH